MRPPIDQIVKTALQLHRAGKLAEAEDLYRQIVARQPNHADALYYLAVIAHQQQRDEQAADLIRQVLAIKPNYPQAHLNMGIALKNRGKTDEAIAAFRQAVALEPDHAQVHLLMALLLLSRGDFSEGWAEYEWRWKCKGFTSARREFAQPQWDGGDLAGSTILIHDEQGLGDTLQFIRYVPLIVARGAKVIVGCDPLLRSLLRRSLGDVQMVDWNDPLPAFDCHCPLMSLPLAFGTTVETIPRSMPYVVPSPERIEKWQEKLSGDTSRCKVGLVWAGSRGHPNDRNRSLELSMFAPVAKVAGASFYSLQKGDAAKQAVNPPGFNLIDHTAALNDFGDTAALIANLDLVISVDTSVVHLAGAMGKPVWALLPFVADWRWMNLREDSPWYPTMRLIRQASLGDWAGVIERVVTLLDGLACGNAE